MAEQSGKASAARRIAETAAPAVGEVANEELMLAHGRGDEASFDELVRRHERGVLNYFFRMLQNRQISEELTQEVFLALIKNRRRYKPTAKFTTSPS